MKMLKTLLTTIVVFFVLSLQVKADVILTGMGGENGLGEVATPMVDDGSSNELNLPFSVNFFGETYESFFVNTNGNLSFVGGFNGFQGSPFDQATLPIIAPFWGDVNINCGGGEFEGDSSSTGECGNIYIGAPAEGVVAVTWHEVAEFGNSESGERNTFQAVLIDRSADTGTAGDFDLEFRYETLDWDDRAQAGFGAGNGFIDECRGGDCDCPGGDCDCPFGDCECPPGECEPNIPQSVPAPQMAEVTQVETRLEDLPVLEETPVLEEVEMTTSYSLPGSLTVDVVDLANTSNTGEEGIWSFSFRDGQFLEPGVTPENPIMPISEGEDGWAFDFDVDFDEIVFIDPDVAVGYDYFVDSGSNFASVILPDGFNANYELWLMGANGWEFSQFLDANFRHFFETGGVSQFRILGIDTSNMVDPTDPNAFVTGLSFVDAGNQQVRQVALTEFVPDATNVDEPNPLMLLLVGCGFIALQRKRKLKVA